MQADTGVLGRRVVAFLIDAVLVWSPSVALFFALIPTRAGRTPGMRVLGLRIVGEDQGNVPFARHLVRTAPWVIDGFPYFAPGLAFLCAAVTPKRQRVGDMAARTLVVRARR